MKKEIKKTIQIPEGVQADINLTTVKISGPKGTVEKEFKTKIIKIEKEDRKIIIKKEKANKKEKTLIGTIESIINGMIKGVQEEYLYEIQICSVHFPMNVKLEGNKIVIKNFFGENKDRIVNLPKGVKVKIDGDIIGITSPDKELAGNTATLCEQSTRLTKRDRRIFQDGLWIITKQKGRHT